MALELARRGATLILACRNIEAAIQTKVEILETLYKTKIPGTIFIKQLDLNSFESIVKFAKSVTTEFKEIYALVNNAGVFYHPQELTEDGFDVTLQTNYLGPFVLTYHLLSTLKRSDHARIINVSSNAHHFATTYDLKALLKCQTEDRGHITAYSASKLLLLLFSNNLSKKLSNTNILVNSVDPGNVETDIYRYFSPLSNPWLYALQWPLRKIVVKTAWQGCQSILHLLLTQNRTTGQYIVDCKPQLPSKLALKESLAEEIFYLTLEILDNKFITESIC